MKVLFEGVGVAIPTPFLYNKVDFLSLEKLIERLICEGASAIIVLGTTGEASTISKEERIEIIKFCRGIIKPPVKMIVGTGNNNYDTCLENTKIAKILGADGALVVTPYYNKTTQRGLEKYYGDLAKLKFPIIMYNVPSRTGLSIEISTIEKIIKKNPYVCGIKEATSEILRISTLCSACKDKIAVYSGEDELNYLFYCLGSQGTISVTSNAFCKEAVKLYRLVKGEKLYDALKVQDFLSPINKLMFCETNPVPVKHFLYKMGVIESDEVRMPLVELEENSKDVISNYLNKL